MEVGCRSVESASSQYEAYLLIGPFALVFAPCFSYHSNLHVVLCLSSMMSWFSLNMAI